MKSLNQHANTRNKWAVIAINETEFWREDIAAKAKTIEGVYLVNLREPTHLCEIAISYPAILLRNFVHNTGKFDEDELTEIEYCLIDNEVRYYHGSDTPKFIRYYKTGKEDEVIESENCNPTYC